MKTTKPTAKRLKEILKQFPVIEDLEYNKALLVANNAKIKSEQAEIERLKKERLEGSLIPMIEVEETFIEIGAKTKAELSRFVSVLPPKLEGLNATSMIDVIREHVNQVLLNLSSDLKFDIPLDEAIEEIYEDDENDQ